MEDIIEPTIDYDFSNLYLAPPSTLSGGAYFTKIMRNNKPLYVQTPKSLTKQGFVKSGKKMYVDLMLNNNDTVFINWIENLEIKCQSLILSKSDKWFETKLEQDDIESAFTSPFKIFKSGKYYLLRVNVKPTVKIYDDNDQIIKLEDISSDKNIISILEIQGIKFSSRNFQIEFELKQSMTVSPDPFLDECFIKKPIKKTHIYDADTIEQNNTNSNIDKFIKESVNDLAKTDIIATANINLDLDLPLLLTLHLEEEVKNVDVIEPTSMSPVNEEQNIQLDIEDLPEDLNDDSILKEVELNIALENSLETITLKKPNQVYYEIYKKAKETAKNAKQKAIDAYKEVKNIKKTYMLDDSDDDSDVNDNDFIDSDVEDEESDTEEYHLNH
jgi:hypothetical protein